MAERITQARKDKGLSMGQLARLVGVARESVSQWERGDTTGIRPVNLVKCADALNVSVRWLVFGQKDSADSAAVGMDARVGALPVGLRGELLRYLDQLEAAARELPFAFDTPIANDKLREFQDFLERIKGPTEPTPPPFDVRATRPRRSHLK
jgi:transcriptional regulator with XRE-family HTH domain